MKERIHIICPVRNVTDEQQKEIDDYCNQLELEGYEVHNPKYAVDQTDETGFNICKGHLDSIRDKRTVRIDIFWDGTSKGSHFDLGMVFATGKPVKIVKLYQDDTKGKSYVKVMDLMKGDYLQNEMNDVEIGLRVSLYIELIAERYGLDVQDISITYDKRGGNLKINKMRTNGLELLEIIPVNDL